MPIGAFSGYVAGKLDRLLDFRCCVFLSGLITALLVVLMFGHGITTMAVAISVSYIPRYYRVVRSVAYSIKGRGFVDAERALGASSVNIVLNFIISYSLPHFIITLISIDIGSSILTCASLGFFRSGITTTDTRLGRPDSQRQRLLTSGNLVAIGLSRNYDHPLCCCIHFSRRRNR